MRLLSRWAARLGRVLRAASIAVDPGEDDKGRPPELTYLASRLRLTQDDLLWFTTSEDGEGRLTLGLLECSPQSIGVLVDDNGESFGLQLSRAEAQDLHQSLVAWLTTTGQRRTPGTGREHGPRAQRRSTK
jgi:hypothetical protein